MAVPHARARVSVALKKSEGGWRGLGKDASETDVAVPGNAFWQSALFPRVTCNHDCLHERMKTWAVWLHGWHGGFILS
jgi:hypothetical protein